MIFRVENIEKTVSAMKEKGGEFPGGKYWDSLLTKGEGYVCKGNLYRRRIMSMIKINGLNVVGIYATDLEAAVAFYCGKLGFEKGVAMPPGVLLNAKGANLTLYVEGGREPRQGAGVKFPHAALCFNAEEGVKAALEKLEKADVKIIMKYGDFNGKFAGFQFEDPSGNVLQFAGKP